MVVTAPSSDSPLNVPDDILLAFFREATEALQNCQISEKPLTISECRDFLLGQQRLCLKQVVQQHNELNDTKEPISMDKVQLALTQLSSKSKDGDTVSDERKYPIVESMEIMNTTARLAFARLVLASECLRTSTSSLNYIQEEASEPFGRAEPLKTSRMTRSELLEFCALCTVVVRLPNVHDHLLDAQQSPLWKDIVIPCSTASENRQSGLIPPIKRVENLQRLLLQAMGYDAEMGMKELARQLQADNNDDVELVEAIRNSTAAMMESLLGDIPGSNQSEKRLSDLNEGGFTRIVSVQHSERIVNVENAENGTQIQTMGAAPTSQSMHSDSNDGTSSREQEWDMAKKAAALRESLAQELKNMNEMDRTNLMQQAEQALQNFQEQAMQRPAGSERVEFLRSMDAETQRLLAMHRIWQEQQLHQQNKNN